MTLRSDPYSASPVPRLCRARRPASLAYCACYVYSPRGSGRVSRCSRLLRARLKAADAVWFPRYAARVHEQVFELGRFSGVFGPDVILVPVPNSTPLTTRSTWVAGQLAIALKQTGLAAAVWAGLNRRVAVRKSATAPDGSRPTVWEHYESLALEPSLAAADRLVLIDDVVTKGRTLLAAAIRLRERFPRAEVRAFALVRTMGLIPDIAQLLEPCQGEISWEGEDAHRDP